MMSMLIKITTIVCILSSTVTSKTIQVTDSGEGNFYIQTKIEGREAKANTAAAPDKDCVSTETTLDLEYVADTTLEEAQTKAKEAVKKYNDELEKLQNAVAEAVAEADDEARDEAEENVENHKKDLDNVAILSAYKEANEAVAAAQESYHFANPSTPDAEGFFGSKTCIYSVKVAVKSKFACSELTLGKSTFTYKIGSGEDVKLEEKISDIEIRADETVKVTVAPRSWLSLAKGRKYICSITPDSEDEDEEDEDKN